MEDIAPLIYEKLKQEFEEKYIDNEVIQNILKNIKKGIGNYEIANTFSIEVGNILSKVFGNNLSSEILPDGKLYFNIAERTIKPMMENNFDIINNTCMEIQKILNEESNLGIKPIPAKLNEDRVTKIIDIVSGKDKFDDIKYMLDEPIINFSQSIVDSIIKENADFHYKAGLHPKIVRNVVGNCCEWCSNLEGTYNYQDVKNTGNNVFRRHKRCRCTVTYHPINGKLRNVWTKKTIDYEEIAKRKVLYKKYPYEISETRKSCLQNMIDYNEVAENKVELNSDEIINKISGGDETEGSCSSIALAYIGNKAGYDVLDYRGGKSQKLFSKSSIIKDIAKFNGVKSFVEEDYNDFKALKRILKNVEDNKEYYLATGKHATIIKKEDGKLRYLELQDEKENGFKDVKETLFYNTWKERFKCQKSHNIKYIGKVKADNILIDIETLYNNDEFKKILGFINTNVESQLKGEKGYAK